MQTTLTVPGGVDMALVVGASDEILHVLEESFDARLTVRGDRIVIEGNAVEVQQLTALFADLFKTVEEGQAPDTDSVRRSVELLRQAEFAPAALRDELSMLQRDLLMQAVAPRGGRELLSGGYDSETLQTLSGAFTPAQLLFLRDVDEDTVKKGFIVLHKQLSFD